MAQGLQRPPLVPKLSPEEQARADEFAKREQKSLRRRRTDDQPGITDALWRAIYGAGDVATRVGNPLKELAIGATVGADPFARKKPIWEESPSLQEVGEVLSMAVPFGIARRGIAQASGPTTRRLLGPAPEIRTFHGTPAPYFSPTARNPLGEFNPKKIGTGEGQQTYGQGAYLTEEYPIGDWYRRRYSHDTFNAPEGVIEWRRKHRGEIVDPPPEGVLFDPDIHTRYVGNPTIDIGEIELASKEAARKVLMGDASLLEKSGSPLKGKSVAELYYMRSDHANHAAEFVSRAIADGMRPEDILKEYFWNDPAYTRLIEAAIEPWKGLTPSKGSLFEVGLRASPDELLDLDKTLSGQSPQVTGPLREVFDPLQQTKSWTVERPEAHYSERSLFMSPEAALDTSRTSLLRERGVPGAQYTGRSSGAKDYVIWDPERLNIIKKLIAAIGAVGGGTLAATGQEPDVRRPEL